MPLGPFLLTLTAALLHASWNTAVKISADRLIAVTLITAGSVTVNIPIAVLVGLPPVDALPYLALSPAVHAGYVVCLATAYDRADLSVAYPIARGMAPLLVSVGGVAFLGDDIDAVGAVGVVLIAVAIGSMVVGRGRLEGAGWALLTGLFIATYSLLDAGGVRAADAGLRYGSWLFIVHAIVSLGVMRLLRSPSEIASVWRANRMRLLVAGAAGGTAYLLVLWSTQRAPAGLVSGIRETSVIFAVLIGVFFLGERVTFRQVSAVVLAAVGALLIGVS